MNRVEDVCDRVVLMNQGRVLLEGPVDAIRADHEESTVEQIFKDAIREAHA